MPLLSRVAAATSKAWGQFTSGIISLAGNYLYVWGNNASQRLGVGTVPSNVARSSPVQVAFDKNFTVISAGTTGGGESFAGITDVGELFVWGANTNGQLGIGSTIAQSSPVQVGTLTNWQKVSVGGFYMLAVKTDGSLWAWGQASGGKLGNGSTFSFVNSPIQIGTLTDWDLITAGAAASHAIKTDGSLWGWGDGGNGALGDGTTISKSSPIQIGTLTDWLKISNGNASSIAVKSDDTLWSWGLNSSGQLGLGNTTPRSSPVQVGTLTTWSDVFALGASSFFKTTSSELYATGLNSVGQLGLGNTTNRSSPVQIGTLSDWSLVSRCANSSFAMAVKTDGTSWGWGLNSSGQLGLGDTSNRSSPVQIGAYTNVELVAVSSSAGYFSLNSNENFASGATTNGQLGQVEANRTVPTAVGRGTSSRKYASVAPSVSGVAAVDTLGKLWTWGSNPSGQLGFGNSLTTASLPTQVGTLTDWKSVYVNDLNTVVAVKQDGTLWAWGANTYGSVGNNTAGPIQTLRLPTPFGKSPAQYSDIGVGGAGLYVLNGALYTNGSGINYETGNGSTVFTSSPTQIGTQTDWDKVYGGLTYSLAIKTDGTLWAWGAKAGYVHGPQYPSSIDSSENYSSPIQIALSYSKLAKSSLWFQGGHTISQEDYLIGWAAGAGTFVAPLGTDTTVEVSGPTMVGTQKWKTIIHGEYFSAAIRNDDTLWSWGRNASGELGLGNTTSTSSPVQVGTLSTWAEVSAAFRSLYAIKSDGTLWATGENTFGELGLGDTTSRSSLTQVGTLTNWSKIGASFESVFAVKTDGTVWSWGRNSVGQLGLGDTTNRSSPVQIGTLTNWAYVQGGLSSVAAVKTDGTLWTWGSNSQGVLGQGTTVNCSSPIQVGTLTDWEKVSAANHMVALKTDGTVWAWGRNNEGQLAQNNTTAYSSPVQIGTLSIYDDVLASGNRTYLLNSSKEVFAAGGNPSGSGSPTGKYFTLGVGPATPVPFPIKVGTTTNTWSTAAADNAGAILIKNDGTLWSAGDDSSGVRGQGSVQANYVLNQVGTLSNWSKIAIGGNSAIAIKSDNSLWAWGNNSSGQLGTGNTTNYSSPVQVGTLTNWSHVNLTRQTSTVSAIKTDGTLWAWGVGTNGQIGNSNTASYSSPIQIGTLTNWEKSLNVASTAFFVKTDDTLWSVGWNNAGQLGDGTTVDKSSPIQIGTGYSGELKGIRATNNAIFAKKTSGTWDSWGYGSTINLPPAYEINGSESSPVQIGTLNTWKSPFVRQDGTAWIWGFNNYGQIGNNTLGGLNDEGNVFSPVQVGTVTTWDFVAKFNTSSGGIRTNGTLWTWGRGTEGQLGNGSTITRLSPVQVGTLTNWKYLSMSSHSLAVKTDGTLWAWGRNNEGQLGQGTTTNRSSPVQVGTLTDWAYAEALDATSIAVKTDGTIWSWGSAGDGSLGNGTTTPNISSPVQIGTLTSWTDVPKGFVRTIAAFSSNAP